MTRIIYFYWQILIEPGEKSKKISKSIYLNRFSRQDVKVGHLLWRLHFLLIAYYRILLTYTLTTSEMVIHILRNALFVYSRSFCILHVTMNFEFLQYTVSCICKKKAGRASAKKILKKGCSEVNNNKLKTLKPEHMR